MDRSTREAFARDGAVLIEGFLEPEQLAQCRAAFDWAIANPGPNGHTLYPGTHQEHHNDNANPLAAERLNALVASIPFGELFADLWGSQHVWYFAEEVFMKRGGVGGRTPWHQDTSYLPWAGAHFANAWISFESVPKANALEIIQGSHRGMRYDGTDFATLDDPTAPLHGGGALPRLPDIEAQRKRDPGAWDIISFASNPGDLVVLHPAALHGGAPVDASFQDLHTIVFRFFGDDATFHSLPGESISGFTEAGVLFVEHLSALKHGDPFRAPVFQQLR